MSVSSHEILQLHLQTNHNLVMQRAALTHHLRHKNKYRDTAFQILKDASLLQKRYDEYLEIF